MRSPRHLKRKISDIEPKETDSGEEQKQSQTTITDKAKSKEEIRGC